MSTNCCIVDSRSNSELLPRVKCVDRRVDLGAVEAQLRHYLARGGDLLLGDSAVGFGDVSHDLERGGEEALADLEHASAAAGAAHARYALVVEVPEDETDDGAPGIAEQQQADDDADEFSGDAHRGQLLRCMANMLTETESPPVHTTSLRGLKKIHTGKVRDIYEIDAHSMLIVTTDRLSAFDVVLPDPIPDKGRVLNSISNFWFERTQHIVPNHLTGRSIAEVVSDPAERAMLEGRAVIVKRLKTVPLEAVVRGYVIGSGWKDYQKTGAISGIKLPAGPQAGGKAAADAVHAVDQGGHRRQGRNHQLSSRRRTIVGADIAARVRDAAIALYEFAAKHARERGIIIADTKFEFAHGRGRLARAHRRSAHARFLALLAGRHLARRHEPALVRQAVRARLSRDARLEQDGAGAEASAGSHRRHAREVSGSAVSADRDSQASGHS